MIEDCVIGKGAVIYFADLVNLYGCTLGEGSTVGPFVEIQRGAWVGWNSKICSHVFVCSGVSIGDCVFVGHGVMFTNDLYPCVGSVYKPRGTVVMDHVSIGSGATILPVTIGSGAIVGAGSVVVSDVPAWSIVAGNPARVIRQFGGKKERDEYLAGK